MQLLADPAESYKPFQIQHGKSLPYIKPYLFQQVGFFLQAGVFFSGSLLLLLGGGDGVFLWQIFFPGVLGSSLAVGVADVPAGWRSSSSFLTSSLSSFFLWMSSISLGWIFSVHGF